MNLQEIIDAILERIGKEVCLIMIEDNKIYPW